MGDLHLLGGVEVEVVRLTLHGTNASVLYTQSAYSQHWEVVMSEFTRTEKNNHCSSSL